MSLIFARSKAVGVATSTRLLAANLRAFQTLTARDNGEKNASPMASPIQTAPTSSLAIVSKLAYPSCRRNGKQLVAQAKRSMAGVPDGQNFRDGKPTLEYAKKMTKTFASMSNDQILHFAEMGVPEACRECIVRDVMSVDQVEYDEAMKVFEEIAKTNREGMFIHALPFYFGCGASVTLGYASIPLVFELRTVEWFNEKFVTTELPPVQDLETWLEVGSASWGWMEPVLGQLSFFLLTMQFARSQMQNLGIRPFSNWMQSRRAERLVQSYPQYDAEFLANYSKLDRLVKPHRMVS